MSALLFFHNEIGDKRKQMRVLYITWDSYGSEDIKAEFDRRGYDVEKYWINAREDTVSNTQMEQNIVYKLIKKAYDFVFSWNYFPSIAIACNACRIRYASWVYDSPLSSLWHCSVLLPQNYIFIFDKADYLELKKKNINTVYYLPLAANVERYDSYFMDKETEEAYSVPISFIGSTYMESRYQGYKKLDRLDRYTRGYVDGLLAAQKMIYGNFILEELLDEYIIEKLREIDSIRVRGELGYSYAKYYGQVVLARYITAMERKEILEMLSEKYGFHLYTRKKTPWLPKIINRGRAGHWKESCFIFRCSRINLNITLRSIRTGIPLRAFEIMGAGGFLLTNYQEDFLDFFEPGIDFVYYDSYEDLLQKTEYYLTHEEERLSIALSGYKKVKKYHTYRNRLDRMLEIMGIG